MNRLSLEEFKEADKLPLIVVLDDVRSLHNVGSVFRSADAFRVEAVYLCGITATPPNAEIHKTALGGEDSVDWRYFERTEDAIEELHRQGVFVYSVEQVEGSTKLQDLNTQSLTSHQHPTPTTQPPTPIHPLRHRHGQRGERGKAKRCRYERRLFGDSTVRNQTLIECKCNNRYCHLGVCSSATYKVGFKQLTT